MPSARDIAFIGCRLLALFVLVSSLQAITLNSWLLLQSFRSQQEWSLQDKLVEWGAYTVPMAVLLVLVAILWARADWIAAKVTTGVTEAQPADAGGWSRQVALSVAVVAIGLWLVVDRLPFLVQYLFLLLGRDTGAEGPVWMDFPNLAATLFAIVLGLFCVSCASPISGYLARLRRW